MTLTYEHNGHTHDITLPVSVGDVTYSAFLDWRSPITDFVQKEVRQQEEGMEKDMPQDLKAADIHEMAAIHQQQMEKEQKKKGMTESQFLVNSFKMFLSIIQLGGHMERPEILEVLNKSLAAIIPEPLTEIAIHNAGDDLTEMLENGVDWFDGGDVTLCRLTCHLCNLFKNYIAIVPPIGDAYQCEYKGDAYYLQPDRVKRLYALNHPIIDKKASTSRRGFTTDEVNEISEYQRIFDKKIERKGDPDGALEFQLNLLQLAILLRKDGEMLPRAREERRKWVHERSLHFQQLPMSVVYEVRAFFLGISKYLLTSLILQHTSGKVQRSPNLTALTQRAAKRRGNTQRRRRRLSMKQ